MVGSSIRDRARRTQAASSVDPDELDRFAAMADEWWDPEGSFRPLHRLNPARLAFVTTRLAAHFARDPRARRPLEGLSVLDVGCGGGLVCEPLARLGAVVTGIDAAADNARIALIHAEESGLDISYATATAEELLDRGGAFDAVLSLEVVEHVADAGGFLAACAGLARPGGALVLATLNRTLRSFLFGIVGAEYVLGWLPRGTHRWDRFVKPSELGAHLRKAGARVADVQGVGYDPATGSWRLGEDVSVNYMAFAVREP